MPSILRLRASATYTEAPSQAVCALRPALAPPRNVSASSGSSDEYLESILELPRLVPKPPEAPANDTSAPSKYGQSVQALGRAPQKVLPHRRPRVPDRQGEDEAPRHGHRTEVHPAPAPPPRRAHRASRTRARSRTALLEEPRAPPRRSPQRALRVEPHARRAPRRFERTLRPRSSARRTRHVPRTLVRNSSALLSDETFQRLVLPTPPCHAPRSAARSAAAPESHATRISWPHMCDTGRIFPAPSFAVTLLA
jgi:hypothetical protein